MEWTRSRIIGVAALALLIVFLIGFVPQWAQNRSLNQEVSTLQYDRAVWRLQSMLGSALADAQRSNYEGARLTMTQFFSGAQQVMNDERGQPMRGVLQSILAERDEIITLLSRAEPQSTERLNEMYLQHYDAASGGLVGTGNAPGS